MTGSRPTARALDVLPGLNLPGMQLPGTESAADLAVLPLASPGSNLVAGLRSDRPVLGSRRAFTAQADVLPRQRTVTPPQGVLPRPRTGSAPAGVRHAAPGAFRADPTRRGDEPPTTRIPVIWAQGVFVDDSGRRVRRVQLLGWLVAIACVSYVAVLAFSLVSNTIRPQNVPPPGTAAPSSAAPAPSAVAAPAPAPKVTAKPKPKPKPAVKTTPPAPAEQPAPAPAPAPGPASNPPVVPASAPPAGP